MSLAISLSALEMQARSGPEVNVFAAGDRRSLYALMASPSVLMPARQARQVTVVSIL